MFTLIATIGIVYIFWLVIKPWLARYARRKMEQRVRDMFARQFGIAPDDLHRGPAGPAASARATHPAPGKKIDRDTGEYVDFEESDTPMPPPPPVHIRIEQQITDIEWEEID